MWLVVITADSTDIRPSIVSKNLQLQGLEPNLKQPDTHTGARQAKRNPRETQRTDVQAGT